MRSLPILQDGAEKAAVDRYLAAVAVTDEAPSLYFCDTEELMISATGVVGVR